MDLWSKRFVRDHVRYIDIIYCSAAKIVERVRAKSLARDPNGGGKFDSMHIRRGDFQYKNVKIPPEELYERTKKHLTQGGTVFIATDEFDKNYWRIMKDNYDVYFLNDFLDDLEGVNSNYFGMIDQLVAARGDNFYGTFYR